MSAAAYHLRLFVHVMSEAVKLSDVLVLCDLEKRRRVTAFSMFCKIRCIPNHAFDAALT